MGSSYYADGVSMWTLKIRALRVHVWAPLKEAAQLSIYIYTHTPTHAHLNSLQCEAENIKT